MTTSAVQQRYWLGDSPPEISHLLSQAEFLGPDAAGLLGRIGVAPSASVIDIGCGVYFHTFLLTLAALMRQDILAGGRLTPGQLDTATTQLRQHLSQPGTLTCLPTIWQAWGRAGHPRGGRQTAGRRYVIRLCYESTG